MNVTKITSWSRPWRIRRTGKTIHQGQEDGGKTTRCGIPIDDTGWTTTRKPVNCPRCK